MFSKNAKNGLFLAAVLLLTGAVRAADEGVTPTWKDSAKAKWALVAAVPAATWAYVWNGDCSDCNSAVWFDRIVRLAGLYTAGTVVYKGAPVLYGKVKSLVAGSTAKKAA